MFLVRRPLVNTYYTVYTFKYLVVRLGVNGCSSFCALQTLLYLLHFDSQMSFKIPSESHTRVFGCLPAREDLIIAQQCPLILWIQDLQSTYLYIHTHEVTLHKNLN